MNRIVILLTSGLLALVVACADTSVDSGAGALESGMGSGSGSGSGSGVGSGSGSGSGPSDDGGAGTDCSPGFYKQHAALWDHIDENCDGPGNSACGPYPELERNCCQDEACTEDVLAELNSRAPHGEGEMIRHAAKAYLDECFADMQPCEEEEDADSDDDSDDCDHDDCDSDDDSEDCDHDDCDDCDER
jgi:hypothetical protein